MSIKEATYIENGKYFKIDFEIRDWGVKRNIQDEFIFDVCSVGVDENGKETSSELSDKVEYTGDNYITFNEAKVEELGDSFKIRLYCHRKIYCGDSIKDDSKESEPIKLDLSYSRSPIFLVYKISPTLSYRRNKVGINYSFPDDASIANPSFVVGTHSTAKNVYFIDTANNQIASIALDTGAMDGFVINCGSWDKEI